MQENLAGEILEAQAETVAARSEAQLAEDAATATVVAAQAAVALAEAQAAETASDAAKKLENYEEAITWLKLEMQDLKSIVAGLATSHQTHAEMMAAIQSSLDELKARHSQALAALPPESAAPSPEANASPEVPPATPPKKRHNLL